MNNAEISYSLLKTKVQKSETRVEKSEENMSHSRV